MQFSKLFAKATGAAGPYPYQDCFATGQVLPQLLSVPTGVGKTATAVLGWLWRRRFADETVRSVTPRRLVYCLPMRTLVEQTRDECLKWLKNLELSGEDVGVHILMGGVDSSDWDAYPERDAIIIGTQDMLLSRALNRGYGMSRYRWPMHFGLLNNDCLWVLDETQLMGVGLTTSAQLAGLRAKLQTYAGCHTLWMSATLDNAALQTIDHPQPNPDATGLTLNDDDLSNERVQQLLNAAKPVAMADLNLSKQTEKSYSKSLAESLADSHHAGTLTLAVINSVKRSQDLLNALQKHFEKSEPTPEICLIHSRFRPADRAAIQTAALDEAAISSDGPGRIVVATQAIEAGVDVSATTLFTELAPWSSLVQRFGRCNRRGICGLSDNPAASVVIVDIDTQDGKKSNFTLPYEPDALDRARDAVKSLEDVGPQSLSNVKVDTPQPTVHVLRRKDLIDLFDTTPDLSGNDLDVSRYIRDSEDTDVQVYWRQWDAQEFPRHPPQLGNAREISPLEFPAPAREELCSVSVKQMRDFADKLKKKDSGAWVWDPLSREWRKLSKSDVRPGMTILLPVSAGGYNEILGWTADPKHIPQDLRPDPAAASPREAMADDELGNEPLEIAQHLLDVSAAAEELSQSVIDMNIPWTSIITAAAWHDVGKAHAAFQTAMHDFETVPGESGDGRLWAKAGEFGMPRYRVPLDFSAIEADETAGAEAVPEIAGGDLSLAKVESAQSAVLEGDANSDSSEETRYEARRGFRHELASVLAWLHAHNYTDDLDINLVAYLVASHHGKVRLSIRSMPNEKAPRDTTKKFARGIHDGDVLPAVLLPDNQDSPVSASPAFTIDLDLMGLGESPTTGASWLARSLSLRDAESLGPFRLAFLETLLRIADWRGSAAPNSGKV